MLTYNMDVEPRSTWLRTTPGALALAQPYRCTETGLFYGNAHFSTARTHKESYILFYTIAGAGLIEQGDARVTLEPGWALLLDCRAPQSYCTAPGSACWHHWWAHIDGAGVAAAAEVLNPQRITAVPLPELTARENFGVLAAKIEDGSTASILRQSLAIHAMLTELSLQALGRGADASNRALVQRAADYLRAHYDADVTLDELVDSAHISKSYFLRLFRQYMGTTPYNYLLCCRITRAKELLVATDLPVGEIGRRTGFSNESNFSTRFLHMEGQSPLQYRRTARGV